MKSLFNHLKGHRKGHLRGFTLIELLVVIAIIGILSSVVLASLNSARNKGNDAAIKSNLASVQVQAEIVYDDSGNNYSTVCANTTIVAAVAAVSSASGGTAVCYDDADEYVVASPLKTDRTQWWCVDYKGIKKEVPNTTKNFSSSPVNGDIDCG